MRKQISTTILVFGLIIGGLVGAGIQSARAQDPTIPTRTPTPDPNRPSPNPTATTGDTGNPPPAPTNTSEPGATATSTTTSGPGAESPAGSQTPSGTLSAIISGSSVAGDCDDGTFIEAIDLLSVYEGPGGDYDIVGVLQSGDRRPILGRAGFADWWQIQFSPDLVGWVDDEDVNEFGNTALIPIVDPPLINGLAPTPGAPWNPTPSANTLCAATPSPTATVTGAATLPPSATTESSLAGGAAQSGVEQTPVTGNSPVTAPGSDTVVQPEEQAAGLGVSPRGSDASRAAAPTSATNLIIPLVGLLLIGGGIVLALLTRNRGSEKPEEPK